MKLNWITTAAVGAFLALPATAHGQDSGWYIGGGVGGGSELGNDLSGGIVGDVDGEGSLSAAGRVGYDFGNKWRLELEGAEVFEESLGAVGSNNVSSRANLRTTAVMLNALYDLEDFSFAGFEPYVGLGAGLVNASLRASVAGPGCTNAGAIECKLADSDSVFGAQALLGADKALSNNLDWTNQLKVFGTGDLDLQGNQTTGGNDLDVGLGGLLGVTALTGLVYKFGSAPAPAAPVYTPPPPPPPPAPVPEPVYVAPEPAPAPAPQTYACSDGTLVFDLSNCAPEPQIVQQETFVCTDGTLVFDQAQCPIIQPVATLNNCGPSPVGIFNVDLNATPKPLNRLGTMPEFGDSHNLTSDQFFQKLQTKYAANENGDRAYLNYLFKSMGYENGFADAQSYMFSEDVLPVGTTGLLGLGKVHHYAYHVLPNNDRDRQAFRIQSANGTVVHFMKTCGNYMYACN